MPIPWRAQTSTYPALHMVARAHYDSATYLVFAEPVNESAVVRCKARIFSVWTEESPFWPSGVGLLRAV